MANKRLFTSASGKLAKQATARNKAGGKAYPLGRKQALTQLVCTGSLNTTFYADARVQLDELLALAAKVETPYLAKLAVYGRERAYMKDAPALICAVLAARDVEQLAKVFHRVIDNGRMLRTFVQILRSGAVGRRSLGSRPKALVRQWFERRSDAAVFRASLGQDPSLADILRMVHPKPATASREALYGYLLGRSVNTQALPDCVTALEAWKADRSRPLPDLPFGFLTSHQLREDEWVQVAKTAKWQMTRMNLNTFARQGVFKTPGMPQKIARRLKNAAEIRRARAFPYQLLMAYKAATQVPFPVRDALHEAMEVAVENVPTLPGKVYVCPDVSGSMTWASATGQRKGATSKVRCIDVAALVAAAVLRRNPSAEVLPFDTAVRKVRVSARDSILTNAERLARVGGGGTTCSEPLAWLNRRKAKGDLVLMVSDNESWADLHPTRGTATMKEWERFRKRNPKARLVCLDIQPYSTSQVIDREDILNVGGFSDQVFTLIEGFARGQLATRAQVNEVERLRV